MNHKAVRQEQCSRDLPLLSPLPFFHTSPHPPLPSPPFAPVSSQTSASNYSSPPVPVLPYPYPKLVFLLLLESLTDTAWWTLQDSPNIPFNYLLGLIPFPLNISEIHPSFPASVNSISLSVPRLFSNFSYHDQQFLMVFSAGKASARAWTSACIT